MQSAITLAGTLAADRHVTLAVPPPRSYNPTSSAASGTVSNAARVVEGMRSDFRRCYNADLAMNPHAEGSVKLHHPRRLGRQRHFREGSAERISPKHDRVSVKM